VYGNLCDNQSRAELKARGVQLTNAIVICRESSTAQCPRNIRRIFAAEGIAAALCFSDPRNVAPNGMDDVYPKSAYMPGDAAMRYPTGGMLGDALTPTGPSVPYMPRSANEDLEKRRANQPMLYTIGYAYALKLIR
jgi:hypothetical protein